MGFLDSIERGLERAVNTAFARTFRSGVQPVEIAASLKKQLDVQAVIVDRDRILTPNRFTARVSEADHSRLQKLGQTLERELVSVVKKYAKTQGYQFAGEVDVEVRSDPRLSPGVLEIDAQSLEGAVGWNAALEVAGRIHNLKNGVTTVGRGADADIRIGDNGASRKHLEVHWNGKKAVAKDLGSTNGSKVDGQRFREVVLAPDVKIVIGETTLTFILVPARSGSTSEAPKNNSFWSDT